MEGLDSDEPPRSEMIVEILRYLVMHPSAKDTVNGIEKWWLSGRASRAGKLFTQESLNLLVAKGWLIARSSPQAEIIYSLNEDRLTEIVTFLEREP